MVPCQVRTAAALGSMLLWLLSFPAIGQDYVEKTYKHCAGIQGIEGTDRITAGPGHVIMEYPSVRVYGTGFRPSSAQVVGNPVGQEAFDINWQVGSLSCLEYTVRYCKKLP